jgi:hypothetical protein
MLWGGWAPPVTAAALVVLARVGRDDVSWAPVSVKLALALALVLLLAWNSRFLSIPRGLAALIGFVALVEAGVAVVGQ